MIENLLSRFVCTDVVVYFSEKKHTSDDDSA